MARVGEDGGGGDGRGSGAPRQPRPPPALPAAQLVLSEIGSSSPTSLQAVRTLAEYLKDEGARAAALETAAGWLADPASASNATVLLVAGMLHALEETWVEALTACHSGNSLEM